MLFSGLQVKMSDFQAPALLRASETHSAMAPSPDIGYSPCYMDLSLGAAPSPIPLAVGSGDLVVTSSASGLGDRMGEVFTPLLGLSTTMTRLGSPRGLRRRRSSFSVADVPGSEVTRSAVVLLASARIGEGSSGTAFSVANPIDRRRYVMKRVPVTDRSMESRLCNEPRLHGRLRHRHIVSYHYSWMEREEGDGGGASLCILLEKCVGELWGLIEESRLNPSLAAKLTLQAAAAVKEMHECGIMHRDLSPWNIFLSQDNDVRVGDLGLAAEIPRGDGLLRGLEEPLDAMPLDSSALDSIYSAPELGSNGGYGSKVDVFSLGLIILTLWGFALRRPPSSSSTCDKDQGNPPSSSSSSSSAPKNSPATSTQKPDGNFNFNFNGTSTTLKKPTASPRKPNTPPPVDDAILALPPSHPDPSSLLERESSILESSKNHHHHNNKNAAPPPPSSSSPSSSLTRSSTGRPRPSLLSSSSSSTPHRPHDNTEAQCYYYPMDVELVVEVVECVKRDPATTPMLRSKKEGNSTSMLRQEGNATSMLGKEGAHNSSSMLRKEAGSNNSSFHPIDFDPSLVPPCLPPLLRRMVDHDPSQRPTAAEVCSYLEAAADRAISGRGGNGGGSGKEEEEGGKRSHSCTLS